MKDIKVFRGEYSFLSNMFVCQIKFENKFNDNIRFFESSEHIYQAYKADLLKDFNKIADAKTPYTSKLLGRKCKLDNNFTDFRLQLMKDIIFAKFSQDKWLKSELLKTRDCYIEEGNYWNDTYWGVCRGIGENHLGKIIMDVRRELSDSI